jgi:predicted RND superfamily exporter protein
VKALAHFVTRRAGLTLCLVLAATACLATGLRYSETRSILAGELPASDPIVQDTALFKERHPDRNYYVIAIHSGGPEGIWNQRTLRKLIEISEEASALPDAKANVQSLATWDDVIGDEEGIEVTDLMDTVPENEAEILALRRIVEADPLLRGRLVSRSGRETLVRVTIADDAKANRLSEGMTEIANRFSGPEVITAYGREIVNAELDVAVAQHIGVLLPISVLLLLVFFYLCFGRLEVVGLSLSVILLSVVDFLGLMGVLRIPQSILSSTVPVLLIVVLGSYVVHLLRRVYEEALSRPWVEAVEVAVAQTGRPILVAAGSTATGLLTLSTFQIYSVREFGILGAGGVILSAALCLTWLPASLVVFRRGLSAERTVGRRWFTRAIDAITEFILRVSRRPRRAILWTAATVAVALVGAAQLRVGTNPSEFFPVGHPLRTTFENLIEHFGGDGFIFLEVSAPEGSTVYDPGFLERVRVFQEDAAELPSVAYVSSAVDRVFMRSHRKFHGDDPAFEVVPGERLQNAQYAEFFRWGAEETLEEMIESSDAPRHLVVDLFADINDSARIAGMVEDLRDALGRHFPSTGEGSAIFGGEYVEWIAQNRYIVLGKTLSVALSILLVGAVCWIVLRTPRSVVAAILPASLAAALVLGLMGFLSIRLDLASCVITAIVVGIGVDFAVHFLLRYREVGEEAGDRETSAKLRERTIRLAAPPILFDTLSNVVAFSVCAGSRLVPVRDFGWLICISMLTCAAATLVLVPCLLPKKPGEAGST